MIPRDEWEAPELDLENTEARVAGAFEEMLGSYEPNAFSKILEQFKCFPATGPQELVVVGPIEFSTLCAHHLLPFVGVAYVGYVPGAQIVGLSKIPRVVEFYSRMLQVQERLTRQVGAFIHERAEAKEVYVLVRGAHECMRCRGVRQHTAAMITRAGFGTSLDWGAFYEHVRLLESK